MSDTIRSEQLIVPVYINEKIVLDMLAIMEDGFSKVSQVNYTEHKEGASAQKLDAGVSTSATILSKLLKIDLAGELSHTRSTDENKNTTQEKVHTNVSLLSKFRSVLVDEKIIKTTFDVARMQVGDFIEVEGELQKNPLINYLDTFVDLFRMAGIFTQRAESGNRNRNRNQQQQNPRIVNQVKAFADELKHSGTIDFILSDEEGKVVLSAQEQYLSNDNISEILGGRFKVLGKVISICKDESEDIDLLRKTTLSVLPENMLNEMFSALENDNLSQFNLPELITKIPGPAIIVIPIAIYA